MFLLTVFLVTMLFSRCYCNLTLFSVQFYSYLNSRRFFSLILSLPVLFVYIPAVYTCMAASVAMFSSAVSTSTIETNSACEHCSCIVEWVWDYAVSAEPFSIVFSTVAREFCSLDLSVNGSLASSASVRCEIDTFAGIQQQQ